MKLKLALLMLDMAHKEKKALFTKLTMIGWLLAIFLSTFSPHLYSSSIDESPRLAWTTTGSLLTARIGHTATLLPNGQVLIVGGHGYSEDLASVELYKPEEGVFVHSADLPVGRTNHTATLLPNGQVLVVGGQFQGGTLASAELYNPFTGNWTETGSLHIARSYHTATLLSNGQVLVAGGSRVASPPVFSQGAPLGSALDLAEIYDPTSGKWSVVDNLHTARYVHTATLLQNGQVLITGGLSSKGFTDTLNTAELYNPATQEFSLTASLPLAPFNHTATLLSNGEVIVIGGQNRESIFTDSERYLPSKGTWIPTGNLAFIHTGHTSTLLKNGQVLVTGGGTNTGVSNDVELYDPAKGMWERASNMNTARSLHTATLLPNGQVLVVGGGNGNGLPSGVLASAELYVPVHATASDLTMKRDFTNLRQMISGPSNKENSSLVNLAACMTIIAAGMVILTACVVLLLGAGLALVFIQRWRK